MEVTPKKLEANRQNALRSTGPRTDRGKSFSRYNALKHGILAREVVVPAGEGRESRERFDELLAELRDALEPVGVLEEMLVERIAAAHWRFGRVLRAERGEIRKGVDPARWSAAADRAGEVRRGLESAAQGLDTYGCLLESAAGLGAVMGFLAEAETEARKSGTISEETWKRLRACLGNWAPEDLRPAGDGAERRPFLDGMRGKEGEALVEAVRAARTRLAAVREDFLVRERAEAEAEIASRALPDRDAIARLAVYERMVEREMYEALRHLERLQRRRGGEAIPPPLSIGG